MHSQLLIISEDDYLPKLEENEKIAVTQNNVKRLLCILLSDRWGIRPLLHVQTTQELN